MSDGEAVARHEAMYAAVPEGARAFAAEAWGETWSHAEMGSLLDFARLMAEQEDERFYREYQKARYYAATSPKSVEVSGLRLLICSGCATPIRQATENIKRTSALA